MQGYLAAGMLSGALVMTVAAVVLATALARSRRPASKVGVAAGETRTPHRLVSLVAAEEGGQIGSEFPALSGASASPEVVAGLRTICQVRPGVAEHVCNLELLNRLREVTGSTDFRFLCGQLADVLSDPGPGHYDLAMGLERGELSWSGFLKEMRSIPMGALRP
jgi:hypothetical protein